MAVTWRKTDKHVYGAIYREHGKDFVVFGTCSAPDGDLYLGIALPYMLTEWGFKGADEPIIRSIATKDTMWQEEYDYEFFIAVYHNEEE